MQTKDQANHVFQSISGSKALLWHFQFVIIIPLSYAWTNMWNKMMEEKAGLRGRIPRQDSK